jgi:hypothetical protein
MNVAVATVTALLSGPKCRVGLNLGITPVRLIIFTVLPKFCFIDLYIVLADLIYMEASIQVLSGEDAFAFYRLNANYPTGKRANSSSGCLIMRHSQ